jgi:histidinol phosphatase-like PHP family hydrolase
MLSLHTHTVFSDGDLTPSESARRSEAADYKYIAFTDHADSSNFESVIKAMIRVCFEINSFCKIKALPGIEITHVHPKMISVIAKEARKLGAAVILVHGETINEPVKEGTNFASLNADIDILAHPGLITQKEIELAKRKGIFLEITTKRGHCLTNGYVAKNGLKTGAPLILGTDAHTPEDIKGLDFALKSLIGAGIDRNSALKIFKNAADFAEKKYKILMNEVKK